MFIQLDDENRIVVSCDSADSIPNALEVSLPNDFDYSLQRSYQIVNEELVHNPEPTLPPPPSLEEALDMISRVEKSIRSFCDTNAENNESL